MGLGHEASASPPRMYGEEGRWVTGIHGTSFRYAGPGGTVVRTHHSQALQLPQTQEGAGLHRADDVVSQVPAEDKRRALTPRPLGGTRPTWVGSSCPSRGWGLRCPRNPWCPQWRPGGCLKDLAPQMGARGLPGSQVRPAQGGCRRALDGRTRRQTLWKWEGRAPSLVSGGPSCHELPRVSPSLRAAVVSFENGHDSPLWAAVLRSVP